MSRNKAGINQYSENLNLPLPGYPLDKRVVTVSLQTNIRDALEKIPPGDRSNYLREVITKAVIADGLLEK